MDMTWINAWFTKANKRRVINAHISKGRFISMSKDIAKNKNDKETNNMTPRAWNMEKGNKTAKFTIATPKGAYTPESDNLEDEIRAAARFGGLKHPVVQVNGEYIDCSDDLPVELISKLEAGTTVAVSAYDIAG